MVIYFVLGSIAGIILFALVMFPKIMQYRKEVLLMKKSVQQLESLNAELQFHTYEHLINQPPTQISKVISIA